MGLGCTIAGTTGTRVVDNWGQRVLAIAMSWAVPCAATLSVVPTIAIALFAFCCWGVFRIAPWLVRLLGQTGINVITRIMGLLLMALWIGRVPSYRRDARLPGVKKRLWRLSLPLMATRLSHTGLRMLCGAVIPQRLMAAGLPAGEAVSRLGMLNGMAMPFLMLPGMLAGALGTVGGPAAARCGSARAEGRLAARLLLAALGAGAGCAGLLYLLAPWIGRTVYRLPELTPLLRALCPLSVLMPVQQVLGGLMTGLGLQKKALLASLLGAAATLLCTFCWTYTHGVLGAGYASLAGHALTLFCCAVFFLARPSTHEKQ